MLLMERIKRLSRRSAIRLASYAVAIVLILAGATFYGFNLALRYRTQLEYTYSRSLDDLSNYLDNINFTLQKEVYSNTPAQIDTLAATLWRDSGAAKNAISQLPVSNTKLDGIYRFLSQVGDYSLSLSKKNTIGQKLTQTDRNNIVTLSGYASKLSAQVNEMQAEVSAGRLWIGEIRKSIESGKNPNQNVSTGASGGLTKLSQSVTDYPTLVYDGPFSDHIFQQKPKLLAGKTNISRDKAKQIAASYMNVKASELNKGSDENSVTPSYVFTKGGDSIAVTKAGGYVVYMKKQREINKSKLNFNEASIKAKQFLKQHNLGTFSESYYYKSDGVCVINYAYTQQNTIVYSDLIKVGVALDTGEIMSVEARGFIMNHHDRKITAPKKTALQAKAVLSPNLTVQNSHLALITTSGLKEVLAYEFVCKGNKNQDVLVYINTDTLQEEQIFILVKTDGGILTR